MLYTREDTEIQLNGEERRTRAGDTCLFSRHSTQTCLSYTCTGANKSTLCTAVCKLTPENSLALKLRYINYLVANSVDSVVLVEEYK